MVENKGRTIDEQVEAIKALPNPKNLDELRETLLQVVSGHKSPNGIDYNEGPFAMAAAAYLAFNYAAHFIGASGFQASGAELMFLAASRGLKGPFAIVNSEDMLYPQYDIPGRVQAYVDEDWTDWAAQEAQKLLDSHADKRDTVAPPVWAHWEQLAQKGES